jgi:hypothetical protein
MLYQFLKPVLDKLVEEKVEFIIKCNGNIYLTYNGNTGQQYADFDPIIYPVTVCSIFTMTTLLKAYL